MGDEEELRRGKCKGGVFGGVGVAVADVESSPVDLKLIG